MRFATPYEWAQRCTDGPAPGARALLAYLLEEHTDEGARSLGIYNCRTVRGGTTRSIHGEGRAVDLGMPLDSDGTGTADGRAIVAKLGEHGVELGVQAIIYDRTIWSAKSPDGRPYGGVHPHYDHLHIELTREAAARLTLATFRHVLGTTVVDVPTEPNPTPPTPRRSWQEEIVATMDTVNLSGVTRSSSTWVRGPNVKRLQGLLVAAGHAPANTIKPNGSLDGIGGPGTRSALEAFQRANPGTGSGGRPDAIAGRDTWAALLGV